MNFSPPILYRSLQYCASITNTKLESKRFLLGFSGGLDSMALLFALLQLTQQISRDRIRLIHIHHGLLAEADGWVEFCRDVAQRWQIQQQTIHVDARAHRGESQEAKARELRYQAFSQHLHDGEILLTAHHQDDQAETVILQLLRGAGVRGLAAMPYATTFANGQHWRPLLDFGRRDLIDYVMRNELTWVEDPSNAHLDYDRNFLRHQVFPILQQRWPTYAAAISRSASSCADAAGMLDEEARKIISSQKTADGSLSVASLLAMTTARRRNALMVWIRDSGLPSPSFVQLVHIETDVLEAKPDATPLVEWTGCQIRRYRDRIYAMKPVNFPDPSHAFKWDGRMPLVIDGIGVFRLRVDGNESTEARQRAEMTIRFRRGGETCLLPRREHRHDVKKLMQRLGIPPWQRQRIPLIYVADELLCVPGYWECESYRRLFDDKATIEFTPEL